MMTHLESLEILREDNPLAKAEVLRFYLDAFFDYLEAQQNIAKHGTIVAHPRTSEPIKNPYLPVKVEALKAMKSFPRPKKVERLWRLANADMPTAESTPAVGENGETEETPETD